jgi:hypothetical protein
VIVIYGDTDSANKNRPAPIMRSEPGAVATGFSKNTLLTKEGGARLVRRGGSLLSHLRCTTCWAKQFRVQASACLIPKLKDKLKFELSTVFSNLPNPLSPQTVQKAILTSSVGARASHTVWPVHAGHAWQPGKRGTRGCRLLKVIANPCAVALSVLRVKQPT